MIAYPVQVDDAMLIVPLNLPSVPVPTVPPEVARSIVGIVLLVLGAITLIALALPGQGALTDWWRNSIAPWFETGRWALPFLLLGAGWYVEWGPGKRLGSGWGSTLVGIAIAFVGFLGAFEILDPRFLGTERGGGRIGRFLQAVLEPLLTGPGAFVVLLAVVAIGLMLAFNLQLRELLRPVTGTALTGSTVEHFQAALRFVWACATAAGIVKQSTGNRSLRMMICSGERVECVLW